MAVIDYSDLVAKAGKVGDVEIQRFRETISRAPEFGAIPDEAAYFEAVDNPARILRIGSWPSFDTFNDAFYGWLSEEQPEAHAWAEAFDNVRATGYDVAYSKTPVNAPVVSFMWFFLSTDDNTELQKYIDQLQAQVNSASGIRPAFGWSADPEHANSEVLLLCGWNSVEMHKKFFHDGFVASAKKSVANLLNVEEAVSKRIEVPDEPLEGQGQSG